MKSRRQERDLLYIDIVGASPVLQIKKPCHFSNRRENSNPYHTKQLGEMDARVLWRYMFLLICHFLISDSSTIEKHPSEAIWKNEEQVNQENQIFSSSTEFTSQFDSIPIINPSPTTTTPIINPTNPPSPTTTTPTYNPMPPPATTNPTPTPTTSTPTSSGGSWCIANPSTSETALQVALDYACGYGGADCTALQPGATCYNPNTLRDHASYAFNDYYQKNPVPTSCVFGGTAQLTDNDPSSGSCRFSTPRTTTPSISPPVLTTPINPYPTSPSAPTGYAFMPSPPAPTFDGTEPTGFVGEPTATPNSAYSISFNLMLLFTTTSAVLSFFALNYF